VFSDRILGSRDSKGPVETGVLVLPKVLEPLRRQLGVSNGVLNVLVSQIVLKRARVLMVIGKLEPAGVAQHVRMDWEWHLGSLAEPAHHSPEPDGTHGCPAFAHEQVAPRFLLSLQSTKRPKLGASQRMHRSHAVLEPEDVEAAMGQVDLLPTKRAQFRCSQPVPEGQQDHGSVPMIMAIVASRLHQPLNFALGEVFAGAIVGVQQTTLCNCSLLDGWCGGFGSWLH
jgi:hypothetical protein